AYKSVLIWDKSLEAARFLASRREKCLPAHAESCPHSDRRLRSECCYCGGPAFGLGSRGPVISPQGPSPLGCIPRPPPRAPSPRCCPQACSPWRCCGVITPSPCCCVCWSIRRIF